MFELAWFFLPDWATAPTHHHARCARQGSRWSVFGAAAFLVSVPVFFQAPLVRWSPELGLVSTLLWWLGALGLWWWYPRQPWASLLFGFSWSWLAGSIYWGWWRTEPLLHLPIEAIALPIALWSLWQGQGRLGAGFYLGSLVGTAITDLFFYPTHLIPYWRAVMSLPAADIPAVLQGAVAQLQTPWAAAWAVILIVSLLVMGLRSLRSPSLAAWAFGGAVLSTLLVDGLFLGSVYLLL
ncbi:MAG: DUF3120 domain-containing protein [Cyanobacteria bacterium P01_G01_bin.54]